jgi:ATP-binding cassette subfamily B (MDR/TAP) protein 1
LLTLTLTPQRILTRSLTLTLTLSHSNPLLQVRSTAGENLGMVLQTVTMLVAGLVLAFIYGWQLALVTLAIGPLIVVAGVLQMKFVSGFQADTKKALEKSGQIATESLAGMVPCG